MLKTKQVTTDSLNVFPEDTGCDINLPNIIATPNGNTVNSKNLVMSFSLKFISWEHERQNNYAQ